MLPLFRGARIRRDLARPAGEIPQAGGINGKMRNQFLARCRRAANAVEKISAVYDLQPAGDRQQLPDWPHLRKERMIPASQDGSKCFRAFNQADEWIAPVPEPIHAVFADL